MLCFPQLSSGALTQFPVVKRLARRTVTNASADGTVWKLGDAAAKALLWTLHYQGLTSVEVDAVTALFDAAEGRLNWFTFLDPTDNLLASSADLIHAPWARDPLVEITGSIADPQGGSQAFRLTNNGQAAQKLEQTLDAPAHFRYCFSFYVRSDYAIAVTPVVSAGSASSRPADAVTQNWRRVVHGVQLSAQEDTITFGIELEAGQTVEVYGMQVEAQAAPTKYKPTSGPGGVYPKARFDDDTIAVTADGPDQHSCTLRIVAGLEG